MLMACQPFYVYFIPKSYGITFGVVSFPFLCSFILKAWYTVVSNTKNVIRTFWPIYETLETTTLGQSGLGSNGNEVVPPYFIL